MNHWHIIHIILYDKTLNVVATGLETGTCMWTWTWTCEIKYNLMTYNNTYNLLSVQAKILCVTKVECN